MTTISHHFLRRRARALAKRLNAAYRASSAVNHQSGYQPYSVVRAERGPYRWRVVQSKAPGLQFNR